jgi:hypothetical protein
MFRFLCEGCGRTIYLFGTDAPPASGFCGLCHEIDRSLGTTDRPEFLAMYDRLCRVERPPE